MPDIKELVKQLGADQETAYKAEKALRELVTRASAPDQDSERKEIASALAGELMARREKQKKEDPDEYQHSPRVRSTVARLLSLVMTDESIMALMGCLRDLQVRESARYALDTSVSRGTTKALILALDEVGPEFRVGVVGALARRRTDEVLKVLQGVAADDPDEDVRWAAIEALGNFPEPANDAIIREGGQGWRSRSRVLVARLRLADTLRKAGKLSEAGEIYRSIRSSDAPAHYRRAADIGLKETA